MATVKTTKEETTATENAKGQNITRLDAYILFFFGVQVWIYFTKSIATNFYIGDLFASDTLVSQFAFFLYCSSFLILFSNFFGLFAAFKSKDNDEKQRYIRTVFVSTILFFCINFGFEILLLRIRQPVI